MTKPKTSTEKMVVSFLLPKENYYALTERLSNYGDKSEFFREVVDQFLKGLIKVERRF